MLKVTHKDFAKLIEIYYFKQNAEGKKIALMVYGTFGIGKSYSIKQAAEKIAFSKNKSSKTWRVSRESNRTKIQLNFINIAFF